MLPQDRIATGGRRKFLRLLLVACVVLVLVWAISAHAQRGADGLDISTLRRHPEALLGAALGSGAAAVLFGLSWVVLARQGVPDLRVRPLLSAFLASWLLRYVPGKVPALGVRVYLGQRLGYPGRPLAIATSIQVVLEVVVSVVAGAVLLLLGARSISIGAAAAALLGLTVSVGALLVWRSATPRRLLDRVLVRLGQRPLDPLELPNRRRLHAAASLVFAGVLINGLALFGLLAAFSEAGARDIPLVAGAAALAGVVGVVVALAPGGLGVREGALVVLLAPRFTPEVVLFVGLLLRVLALAADILLAMAGGGHLVAEGLRATRRGEAAGADAQSREAGTIEERAMLGAVVVDRSTATAPSDASERKPR